MEDHTPHGAPSSTVLHSPAPDGPARRLVAHSPCGIVRCPARRHDRGYDRPRHATAVDRYVAQWTEPDPAARRAAVESLWVPDATHVLHPPEELTSIAATLGFGRTALEARGHDEIETRVARSYEEFIAKGEYTFRSCGDAVRLNNMVKFRWEMVSTETGEAVGGGLDVLVVGGDGRIIADYQYPGG